MHDDNNQQFRQAHVILSKISISIFYKNSITFKNISGKLVRILELRIELSEEFNEGLLVEHAAAICLGAKLLVPLHALLAREFGHRNEFIQVGRTERGGGALFFFTRFALFDRGFVFEEIVHF